MSLTIIMYHYVRKLEGSLYPSIKGRTVDEFKGQLDHIDNNFSVVTAEEVIAAIKGEHDLPDNAAWLTFDDGYIDHYENVFPLLQDKGWQGSFFPPSCAILYGEILDVNLAHFILAAQPDVEKIIMEIKTFIESFSQNVHVLNFSTYWEKLAHPSRYDPAEVIFIKRILQYALPKDLHNKLARQLFRKFVTTDMKAFAAELYMSADQIKTMVQNGMYVGNHGTRHYWMDQLTAEQQLAEINESKEFLHSMGAPINEWVMCYPYGAHNESLRTCLKKNGCVAALTTEVSVANIGIDQPLELPRLDTNDFPVSVN